MKSNIPLWYQKFIYDAKYSYMISKILIRYRIFSYDIKYFLWYQIFIHDNKDSHMISNILMWYQILPYDIKDSYVILKMHIYKISLYDLTEKIPQGIQRHRRTTLHWSAHPQWEQDEMEKSGYGLDRPQKSIWYGPTKLDYKLSQIVQNIRWSHYFIEKAMKTWRVELTAAGKNWAETKIQRGIFQGDALSPLLFIIAMMPLNHILRKCIAGKKHTES